MLLNPVLATAILSNLLGGTYVVFNAVTDVEVLSIWSINPDRTVETDTPRSEIVFNAGAPVVEGQFELIVTYLGASDSTGRIDWNIN